MDLRPHCGPSASSPSAAAPAFPPYCADFAATSAFPASPAPNRPRSPTSRQSLPSPTTAGLPVACARTSTCSLPATCATAWSPSAKKKTVIARLFAHRFRAGDGLDGHNFGNLFVAALTEITGDFAHAIQLASKILATRGRIYPATTANATLVARMDDGSLVRGETKITASRQHIAELMLDPPDAAALPETLEAIERADLISVGPGSLYTSLITNLLVQGIPSALANARGVRVFVCNLMTQANESLGLTASQHIERIYEHTRAPIFDYAIVNTAPFSPQTITRYAAERAAPIESDIERIEALGVRCIAGDFASEESVVRHASTRVTGALLALGHTIPPHRP